MQIKNESFWLESSHSFSAHWMFFLPCSLNKNEEKTQLLSTGFLQCISSTGFVSLIFIFASQIHAKPSYDLAGSYSE